MNKLIFTINNETFIILVKGKEVYYKDRKMPRETRIIPPDERIKVKMSRNIVPKYVAEQFNLTDEEKKEYDNCKNEDELAEVCIKDCEKCGSVLQKRER